MTWAGVSTATAAALASLRGLMQLAGRVPLLSAINRFTASRLIVISRFLLGISALFLLGSGNIALALIYIVLAGVTIGALSALDGVVAREVVQPQVFGTVMGGIGLIATLGGSLGPIFAGWLRDRFDSPVAPMLIVLIAACSSAIIFAIKPSSD
jgi:sugar phosphate permease